MRKRKVNWEYTLNGDLNDIHIEEIFNKARNLGYFYFVKDNILYEISDNMFGYGEIGEIKK